MKSASVGTYTGDCNMYTSNHALLCCKIMYILLVSSHRCWVHRQWIPLCGWPCSVYQTGNPRHSDACCGSGGQCIPLTFHPSSIGKSLHSIIAISFLARTIWTLQSRVGFGAIASQKGLLLKICMYIHLFLCFWYINPSWSLIRHVTAISELLAMLTHS